MHLRLFAGFAREKVNCEPDCNTFDTPGYMFVSYAFEIDIEQLFSAHATYLHKPIIWTTPSSPQACVFCMYVHSQVLAGYSFQ